MCTIVEFVYDGSFYDYFFLFYNIFENKKKNYFD